MELGSYSNNWDYQVADLETTKMCLRTNWVCSEGGGRKWESLLPAPTSQNHHSQTAHMPASLLVWPSLRFTFRDKEAWRTCMSVRVLTEGCFACTLSQMVVVQGLALISSGLHDRFSESDFIFRSRVIYVFGNVQQHRHSVHCDFELACVSPATISWCTH